VVATGIASVAAQLVFVREYLAQFQGNEIVIALIFFCWLAFGGAGSVITKFVLRRNHIPSSDMLARLSCLLALFAVLQVVGIRRLRDVAFIHGASVGFYPTLGFIAVTILPYALLVGFVLPYSLAVIRQWSPRYPGNRIYLADNAGDVAGGALFSFVCVHWLSPLQVLLAVHLPLLACVGFLNAAFSRRTGIAIAAAIVALAAGTLYEDRSLPKREGRRIDYAESRYSRIEVIASQGEVTIYTNGQPAIFSNDPALAEETVHFPVSQIERPRRVLLISTVGGALQEIFKYHPQQVDYVELDPVVARMQVEFGLVAAIAGLNVIFQDARSYLKQTFTQYDAIIVNLTEPETFQSNRFFTKEFFELAKRRLAPGGVFSFNIQAVANYISAVRQQKLSSLANTASTVFRHLQLMPGQRLFFICRDEPIRTDIPDLLTQKGIETQHIRRYFSGDLTDQRIRQINSSIDKHTPLNLDLSPRLMRLAFLGWFQRHGESPQWFMIVLLVVAAVYLVTLSRPQWVLLTTGCINIGAEMVTIFAFQIFYGYIYMQIGVLVTIFLAGLLPGAWAGGRFKGNYRRALMAGDMLICLLLVSLALILTVASQGVPVLILYGFGLLVSFCCGFQFPLALMVSGDSTVAATEYFSVDLVGAAMGVLLVSLVLIPLFGLLWATLCLAAIKLISLTVAGSIRENA
jgi:spermidine synthase